MAEKTRQNFVRIQLDIRRKLRFKHKDLRDVVKDSGKTIGELYQDPFGGWPYLLLYGLRWQDLKLTLDKGSEFIDLWVEEHAEEEYPLASLGQVLIDALNASGFIRIQAESAIEDEPTEDLEGNAKPEAATR